MSNDFWQCLPYSNICFIILNNLWQFEGLKHMSLFYFILLSSLTTFTVFSCFFDMWFRAQVFCPGVFWCLPFVYMWCIWESILIKLKYCQILCICFCSWLAFKIFLWYFLPLVLVTHAYTHRYIYVFLDLMWDIFRCYFLNCYVNYTYYISLTVKFTNYNYF